ncbi:MAG: hypothetical protein ACYTET_06175 [Planctomycetota bacterium]|jgi:hypothetical protein
MKHIRQHRKGFAVLMVLVVVVIIMLLYFVQMDAIFGPHLPTQPVGIEQRPWLMEELLVAEGEGVKVPRSPKLELNEPFEITANVSRDENPRGTVKVFFDTDGRINATWDCTYQHNDRTFTIIAKANGNIDTKQTYKDAEDNKDKTQLFFIAKGTYTKSITDPQTGTNTETGTAYVLGWIDPNKQTTGHVTITTDKEWVAAYEFKP